MLVLGAGGHGKSVLGILLTLGRRVVGLLDDAQGTWGRRVLGVPVLGPLDALREHPACDVAHGLGDNRLRRELVERFPAARWLTVIDPGARVDPSARVGAGTSVFFGAFLGPDAVAGAHAIVSVHSMVGHDAVLGDFVQVAPGVQVGGGARIEAEAMLGLGSAVCPGVRIGARCTLGAGAVALHDLPEDCLAVGVPARPRPASLPEPSSAAPAR
ncbi:MULTISPECIES: acetyltransferase [Myxococcaceae]|uniref:acetyltransferase n=1 Tax=Myxococcaceae TaxID=31 RepID=UPI00188DEE3A|nr:acetyltransferase [Simulacricoccus sp. 17bor-14]